VDESESGAANSVLCRLPSQRVCKPTDPDGQRGLKGGFQSRLLEPREPIPSQRLHQCVEVGQAVSQRRTLEQQSKGGCLYDVCPTSSAYAIVRPVFLIRDPIRVFDSWRSVGWTDAQSLINCYINMIRILHQSKKKKGKFETEKGDPIQVIACNHNFIHCTTSTC
jgi:hypothetical protein